MSDADSRMKARRFVETKSPNDWLAWALDEHHSGERRPLEMPRLVRTALRRQQRVQKLRRYRAAPRAISRPMHDKLPLLDKLITRAQCRLEDGMLAIRRRVGWFMDIHPELEPPGSSAPIVWNDLATFVVWLGPYFTWVASERAGKGGMATGAGLVAGLLTLPRRIDHKRAARTTTTAEHPNNCPCWYCTARTHVRLDTCDFCRGSGRYAGPGSNGDAEDCPICRGVGRITVDEYVARMEAREVALSLTADERRRTRRRQGRPPRRTPGSADR